MAHHLAEKLTAFKSATGLRKQHLGRECRDCILQIWRHRASFPYGHRPFQEFEAVFRALESLDPSRERNRYFSVEVPDQTPPKSQPDGVKVWLDAALSIDRGARALIRVYLDMAVAAASKGKDDWIKAVRALISDDRPDRLVIIELIDRVGRAQEKPDPIDVQREWLAGLRDSLKEMVQGAAKVMPMLNSQIADLEKKSRKPKPKTR